MAVESRLLRRPRLRIGRPCFPEGDLVPWPGLVFVAGTGAAASALAAMVASGLTWERDAWLAFGALALLAALTDLFAVRGVRHSIYDTAAVFLAASAIVLPLAFAPFAGLLACAVDAARRRASSVSFLHNSFTVCLATLGASAVAHGVNSSHPASRAAILLGAALAYAATTIGLDSLFSHFARGDALPATSAAEIGVEVTLASLGVALAAFWLNDPWLIPFVLPPLVFIHRSQRLPALEEEAVTDPKTGLLNMRRFQERLAGELTRAGEQRRSLSLLVVDLDLLREVNNKHGHLAGDAVIQGVAELVRGQLRKDDLAARFGGEEFLVALPGTPPETALEIAERIRASAASRVFRGENPVFTARVTLSVGVAAFPRDAPSALELVHAADLAVLAAKARGRNRIVDARSVGEPMVPPRAPSFLARRG